MPITSSGIVCKLLCQGGRIYPDTYWIPCTLNYDLTLRTYVEKNIISAKLDHLSNVHVTESRKIRMQWIKGFT